LQLLSRNPLSLGLGLGTFRFSYLTEPRFSPPRSPVTVSQSSRTRVSRRAAGSDPRPPRSIRHTGRPPFPHCPYRIVPAVPGTERPLRKGRAPAPASRGAPCRSRPVLAVSEIPVPLFTLLTRKRLMLTFSYKPILSSTQKKTKKRAEKMRSKSTQYES
jgi:hypothetical protein